MGIEEGYVIPEDDPLPELSSGDDDVQTMTDKTKKGKTRSSPVPDRKDTRRRRGGETRGNPASASGTQVKTEVLSEDDNVGGQIGLRNNVGGQNGGGGTGDASADAGGQNGGGGPGDASADAGNKGRGGRKADASKADASKASTPTDEDFDVVPV